VSSAQLSARGVRWDLGDLFNGPDDSRIEQILSASLERAQLFAQQYRGTLAVPGGPPPERLLAAVRELEGLEADLRRVGVYADLLYASDAGRAEYRALKERVELQGTAIGNTVLFFELEWMELAEEAAERLLADPTLAGYRHYLSCLRRFRPHRLSEPEERLLNERDNTGRRAFARLFTESTTALSFPVERDGTTQHLTLSEVLALAHHPDRALRRRGLESLYGVLAVNALVLTSVYDTLLLDSLTLDRLRRYPTPMAERHLANEIDPEAVERMLVVAEHNYGLARRYFALKARLLGLPRLALFDQYAPVGEELPACSYPEAERTILEAFQSFAPLFRDTARRFFEGRWIDAEVRPGKVGGAFCASVTPELHPYILCNYTDNLRDVLTVAHELGHGLHGYLARQQSLFNAETPLTLAETASVFCEAVVFDHLLRAQTDPRVRLALLCGKIEETLATVFRQTVLTRFEQAVFERRARGRLTAEALCAAWLEANQAYYGDAVEMTDGYRWGWSYISHFIHSRFYCYSYVFGELLVLSLYRRYKEEGAGFVPRYVQLLERGGSDSPEALLQPLGVDFHDPAFWQRGFDELGALIEMAEELAGPRAGRS
jgi:oligoendopeptidase F